MKKVLGTLTKVEKSAKVAGKYRDHGCKLFCSGCQSKIFLNYQSHGLMKHLLIA